MPQPDPVDFKRVDLDSTVELVADHFNALATGTALWLNAARGDTLNIPVGLLGFTQETITHINNGFVDEYELTVTPTSHDIRLRGRDVSSLILDHIFEKSYILAKYVKGPFGGLPVFDPAVQTQIRAAQQTSVLYPNGHLFDVGVFTARQIAQDVVTRVGVLFGVPLILDWQVRDYTLRSTFVAKGRAIETLRKLIEPWTQVEPFRADVIVQGQRIIVRYRQLPGQAINPNTGVLTPGSVGPLTPQYTFDITSMRRSQLIVRKRLTAVVGRLRLLGLLQARTGSAVTVVPDNTDTIVVSQESDAPDPTNPGNLVKTITSTTYRLPQQLMVSQTKDVFAPFQTLHEETNNTYADTDQGPLLTQQQTVTQEFSAALNILATSKRVTKTCVYDQFSNQMQCETIITEIFDTGSGTWTGSIMNIKTYTDVAAQMVEVVTAEFTSASTQGVVNQLNTAAWTLVKRDSQIVAGHRSGGAGRGFFIPNGSANLQPIEVDRLLSTAIWAVPVEYSNTNLSIDDLNFLLQLYIAQNKFTFEFEVQFDGVSMPWLQRGVVIQIINIFGPDNVTPIPLPPLYITEARTTYDESNPKAEFVTKVRAFGWQ